MKIPEHIKTIISIAVILMMPFIPLSAQDKDKSPAEAQTEERKLKDGVYETEISFIAISVTIKNNKITDINMLEHGGGGKKYEDMVEPLINRIIKKQSTKVDGITGATVSSNYLKEAVDEALRRAAHCEPCKK